MREKLNAAVAQLQAVSMESGLVGRNNRDDGLVPSLVLLPVSMESGLVGRNNGEVKPLLTEAIGRSQWSPA